MLINPRTQDRKRRASFERRRYRQDVFSDDDGHAVPGVQHSHDGGLQTHRRSDRELEDLIRKRAVSSVGSQNEAWRFRPPVTMRSSASPRPPHYALGRPARTHDTSLVGLLMGSEADTGLRPVDTTGSEICAKTARNGSAV